MAQKKRNLKKVTKDISVKLKKEPEKKKEEIQKEDLELKESEEIQESNDDEIFNVKDEGTFTGLSRKSLADIFPGLEETGAIRLEKNFIREGERGNNENSNQDVYELRRDNLDSEKSYNLNGNYKSRDESYNGSGMQGRIIDSMVSDSSSERFSGNFRRIQPVSNEWGMSQSNNINNSFEQRRDYESHKEEEKKKRRDRMMW